MSFEKRIIPENPESSRISSHLFRAIFHEYILGKLTDSECFQYMGECIGEDLTVDDQVDIKTIMSQIDVAETIPDKMAIIDEHYRVMLIAENPRISLYKTAEEVRERLSWKSVK